MLYYFFVIGTFLFFLGFPMSRLTKFILCLLAAWFIPIIIPIAFVYFAFKTIQSDFQVAREKEAKLAANEAKWPGFSEMTKYKQRKLLTSTEKGAAFCYDKWTKV